MRFVIYFLFTLCNFTTLVLILHVEKPYYISLFLKMTYTCLLKAVVLEGRILFNRERAKSTNRETVIILCLYLLFFLWWYLSAYSFGNDSTKYKYILGFPEWFFYSCIVGYIAITVILWIVVKYFFKDIPLEEEESK